ncbi:MAG: hypothetical protein ACP5QP_03275 [Brevinematia bacterium]
MPNMIISAPTKKTIDLKLILLSCPNKNISFDHPEILKAKPAKKTPKIIIPSYSILNDKIKYQRYE